MLAQKFGVPLPETSEGGDDARRRDAGVREALLKVHEVAAAYFREQLAGPAGARARQQLQDRGVTQATIEQLGLGYAPQRPRRVEGPAPQAGLHAGRCCCRAASSSSATTARSSTDSATG